MSGEYTVGVEGWLACAWQVIKTRPNTVVRGLAIIILFSLLGIGLGMVPGGNTIVLLLQITVGQVLQAGWYLFCLRLVRDENASPSLILEPFNRFGQVWVVAITIPLLVIAGLLFLIIPGLYLWTRYGLGIFAAVDRKLGLAESLELSSQITEGNRLQILLLHLILAVLSLLLVIPSILEMENLGAITFLVYIFVMTPLAGLAYAAAYDSLIETKSVEERL
jgi:hypothetical protein